MLFTRLLLGFIFLSTSYTKIINFRSHLNNIKEYDVIPTRFVYVFGFIDILLESFIGTFLVSGIFIKETSFFAAILLLLYSCIILINLRRNNKINCACGGILGDHNLSITLIIRNFIFVVMAVNAVLQETKIGNLQFLFTHQVTDISLIYNFNYVVVLLFTIVSTFILQTTMNLLSLRRFTKPF